jgi:hypothetical protein
VQALTEVSPAAHSSRWYVRVGWGYLYVCLTEKSLEHALACATKAGIADYPQLDAVGGGNEFETLL